MRQQVHEWANGASYDADNTMIEQDLAVLTTDARAHALLELRTDDAGEYSLGQEGTAETFEPG